MTLTSTPVQLGAVALAAAFLGGLACRRLDRRRDEKAAADEMEGWVETLAIEEIDAILDGLDWEGPC